MSGKTDVVKGRIKEAAGALTGNDKLRDGRKDRPGSREGQAGRPEVRRHSKKSRKKSDWVIEGRAMLKRHGFSRLPASVSAIVPRLPSYH